MVKLCKKGYVEPMENNSPRRKLGLICVGIPVVMLILGQTVLKTTLDGAAFLVYWLICFLFTFAGMFIALWDIRVVRRQSREQTRELMESALTKTEEAAARKAAGQRDSS